MIALKCKLVAGHQVASGGAKNTPYPAGSITLQLPFFRVLGLDLTDYFAATLNLSTAPKKVEIKQANYRFENVQWIAGFPAETFSFVECEVEFNQQRYDGWIYYPHPETKIQHFQENHILEVITHKIPAIQYGDMLTLTVSPHHVSIC